MWVGAALLCRLGRGYAELRINGVLRSSLEDKTVNKSSRCARGGRLARRCESRAGRRHGRIRVRTGATLLAHRTRGDRIHQPLASLRGEVGTRQASLLASLEASGVPIIERCYSPGEHPYMRGDPDEGMWFLLGGTLEVYKLYGAFREATVRLLTGEGLFGELSLRPTGRHRDSAVAISACRVAKVPSHPCSAISQRIQVAPPRCLTPSPSALRSAKLWWIDCSIGR